MVCTTPPPGRGITASRWRFGRVSRCIAYCTQGQPRTSSTEGTSRKKLYPCSD